MGPLMAYQCAGFVDVTPEGRKRTVVRRWCDEKVPS
jgi:hypothetical protein